MSVIEQFDRVVDGWFDHLRGRPWADRLFYTASEAADFSLVWHVIGAGAAVAGRESEGIRLAAALGAESLLVNGAVKAAFRRRRPVVEVERPHRLRIPLTTSFPSGHASSAMMAAALLASTRPRRAGAWYALACVVASSRIHVRIHHASDVVGGAVVGLALAAVVKRVWPLAPTDRARR